jgi:hypothetical protein
LAKQVANTETQWYARLLEGKAQRKLDQLPQAIQSFTEAITIVESLRGRPTSGELAGDRNGVLPYLAMVDLLVEQNKPADAFAYAERAESRPRNPAAERRAQLWTLSEERTSWRAKSSRSIFSLIVRVNHALQRRRGDQL